MAHRLASLLILLPLFFLASIAAGPLSVRADAWDPAPGYYQSATGSGVVLRQQLHDLIDAHTVVSYDAARTALQITDQDPSDPDRIILAYNRHSLDVSNLMGSGIPGWDNGVSWSREHTWPRSHGVGTSGPDNSDLHQLRPVNPTVNNNRGNLNFGGEYGQPYGQINDGGTAVWYPGDLDAGMIARQQFYMDVRYDGSDSNTENLVLQHGAPQSGPFLGDLSRMLQWHYLATPDDFERRRNHIIDTAYQHNRNPFIDRPELVWSVFVDQANDSRIVLSGAPPSGDGATQATIDFGAVLVGAPASYMQSIDLTKQGDDGTYFQVNTSNNTSTNLGRFSAFRTGGSDSKSFDIEFTPDTSAPGQQTGLVTIDNLDITTEGGAGRGANDGDDQVQLALDVLSHARPSFALEHKQLDFTLDFGTVSLGSVAPALDFALFNREDALGYTAALELDQIFASGDTASFQTTLAPFIGAEAMSASAVARQFTATLDTSMIGSFQASFALQFSDEDLLGATELETLTLTLNGIVTGHAVDFNLDGLVNVDDLDMMLATGPIAGGIAATGLEGFDLNGDGLINLADRDEWLASAATINGLGSPYLLGDTNLDGVVNGTDFIGWNSHKFTSTTDWSSGDFNGDGAVNGADFIAWNQRKFQASAAAVPEPSAGPIVALILAWVARRHRRRQPR